MVSSARAASAPVDPSVAARWRARLDALTHWCLSELPLAPGVAGAVASTRATLGDLLRRALGRDGVGVVDLLDALDAPNTPAARALLGRVLGADLLLVVVTARAGSLVRADARACRTVEEARALVDAYLGAFTPAWVAEFGVADAGGVRSPALAVGLGGMRPDENLASPNAEPGAGDVTVVLPFLTLAGEPAGAAAPSETDQDEPAAREPTTDAAAPERVATPEPTIPSVALPAILGGVLRPGAAFLDAPAAADVEEVEDEDATDEDATDADATEEHDADEHAADEGSTDEDAADADDQSSADRTPASAADPDEGEDDDDEEDEDDAEDADEVDRAAGDPDGALDRLRARTSAAHERVSMLIASDDGEAEHVTDVAGWLAEASEQELRALARGGWSGDAAVEVAHALAEDDPEARDVVQAARRHEAELVVEIDARAAVAWLTAHRPDAARRLAPLL